MAILIVGYTLSREGCRYPEMEKFIGEHRHIRFTDSSFAIETNETPFSVRERLKSFLGKDENLVVLHLSVGPNEIIT